MAANEQIHEQINQYIVDLFAHEDEVLQWIQAESIRNNLPTISLRPHEARLLQMLAYAVGARKVVEIGTLAGYSGVWLARALPPDGRLYTLDNNPAHARVARASFERAGLSTRVVLVEGPALESLAQLRTEAPFDLVFIDADKASYRDYLAWAVENLRAGGVVAAHNALRGGRILAAESEDDRAIGAFNRALAEDERLESTIIAVGDGMAVGVKKRQGLSSGDGVS